MSVHDLLIAMLLPSANDAAEDLADNVGHGSIGRFVAMMNARARALGLDHTHYATPIGLDTPDNYSSAHDLVVLARHLLLTQPFFKAVVRLPHAVLRTGNHVRVVTNLNDLVAHYPWINGVKTGHTIDAGYVLVASGRRHGMTLLSAVLGTASEAARDANTMALLDFGFSSFRLVRPVRAGSVVARPGVRDRPGEHVAVVAARGFRTVVERRQRVELRVQLPRQLAGPLPRGAVVGSVEVVVARRPVVQIPLLVARALSAVSPLALAARFILRPAALVSLLVLLGASIAVVLWWRDRTGTSDERGAETA
jgi:D-alanyl-D-alanine carboxypeptidase (penicillin-binding protein 5/6)